MALSTDEERDNWRTAIRKEIRSMIKQGFCERQTERRYPATEDLLEIFGYSRSREIVAL